MLAVVLGEQLLGGDHEFEALDRVPLQLDAADDLPREPPGEAVGLDDDEGVLQIGVQQLLRVQQDGLGGHSVSFGLSSVAQAYRSGPRWRRARPLPPL